MNTLPHKDGGLEMPPKLWTLRSLDIRIHMYAVHYGSFTLSYDDCLETKASLTLARIFFLQCTAIWRAKLCCFSDVKSVKTAGWRIVYAMSCHIVSSVTHKSRSSRNVWHAMSRTCTSQCSRHKSRHLGKQFWNISKFSTRHGTHYFTWPASPRIPTHTVTSSSFIGTPNCVPWRKPFVLPVWGLLKSEHYHNYYVLYCVVHKDVYTNRRMMIYL